MKKVYFQIGVDVIGQPIYIIHVIKKINYGNSYTNI